MRDTPLILVADDDADHREILAWRLETRGYAVVLAADGVEALALTRERRPDLVLMDASMPRLDGFEVCRRIKADPSLPFTPIILVTGRVLVEDVVAGVEAGAGHYPRKRAEAGSVRA